MTDEKLSERMKNAKIVTSGALKVDSQDQNVIWIDARLDLWIPDAEALETEKRRLQVDVAVLSAFLQNSPVVEKVELYNLFRENQQLKEQLEKSQEAGAYNANQQYQRAEKAEAEVERQDGALARQEESLLETVNDLKEAKDRLAKAQSILKEASEPYGRYDVDADFRRNMKEALGGSSS